MKNLDIAVVIHNLSKRSGEGKVTLSAIEMLMERKVNFIVITFSKPKENYHEIPITSFLPFNLPRFDRYQRLLVWLKARKVSPKIFLNMTGIPIPLSKNGVHVIYAGLAPISLTKYSKSLFWKIYNIPFSILMRYFKREAKKAKFIANSYYSAKNLYEIYGINARVIYPPIDYEYYSKALSLRREGNYMVTIARIEKGKQLENAIYVSAKTKIPIVIIGYLANGRYYNYLQKLSKQLNADVKFLMSASNEQVLEVLSKACCYFHPNIGEHFGMPVVEAMAAGLIPVVPKESGAAEIVPEEYSYVSLDEAVQKIFLAVKDSKSRSVEMNKIASNFTISRFKEELWSYIKSLNIL